MAHDVPVSTPEPTGRPMRGLRQSVGDMLRSMVVVLAVVGAILLITWRPSPDPIREVPVEPVAIVATAQADFPVLVVDAPHGGTVTSVRWESTPESDGDLVWHVGYVTPEEEYLQLSQSLADSPGYVAEQTSDGRMLDDYADLPAAVQGLTGEGWVPWERADRRSLVRDNDGSTTILTGTASWSDLADAASHLVLP
jgi:hypothetical protein